MNEIKVLRQLVVPEVGQIHGLTWDGEALWCADGAVERLARVDPSNGRVTRRLTEIPADAGTTFDGRFLWQIGGDQLRKIDPASGKIVHTVTLPDGHGSGLSWNGSALWVGNHAGRFLIKIDPATGWILHRVESDAHVCGVTFTGGALWHCAWTTRKPSPEGHVELRRVDPDNGRVLQAELVPHWISGIEGDGAGRIWAGLTTGGRVLLLQPS